MDSDLINPLGLSIRRGNGDLKHRVAAAGTQVFAVYPIGGALYGFRGEGHGGDFKGNREGICQPVRVKGRGEGSAGRRQRQQPGVVAESRVFLFLFLAAMDDDLVDLLGFPVLGSDGDLKQGIAAASA